MKRVIFILLSVIALNLFCGCKDDFSSSVLIVGKWKDERIGNDYWAIKSDGTGYVIHLNYSTYQNFTWTYNENSSTYKKYLSISYECEEGTSWHETYECRWSGSDYVKLYDDSYIRQRWNRTTETLKKKDYKQVIAKASVTYIY